MKQGGKAGAFLRQPSPGSALEMSVRPEDRQAANLTISQKTALLQVVTGQFCFNMLILFVLIVCELANFSTSVLLWLSYGGKIDVKLVEMNFEGIEYATKKYTRKVKRLYFDKKVKKDDFCGGMHFFFSGQERQGQTALKWQKKSCFS